MSKQRRKHRLVVARDKAYKMTRLGAYWGGYRTDPRWRQQLKLLNKHVNHRVIYRLGPDLIAELAQTFKQRTEAK